mmetsp:Transcript_12358/g.26168  ORF Transcript_12358/g.26168 Transcript_12358/m.26168 type:complete len:166 (-) Transcript_12358:217-714(-)
MTTMRRHLPIPLVILTLDVVVAAALLISTQCIQPVHGGATAEAEQKLYWGDTTMEKSTAPRFPDYHALLDWYYAEVGAGRKPDAASLKDEIRSTMKYRLAQPQVYYDGTGYVPGFDEGWRPDVDGDTYREYRKARDRAMHKTREVGNEEMVQVQQEKKMEPNVEG